jgi:hypothetical protein
VNLLSDFAVVPEVPCKRHASTPFLIQPITNGTRSRCPAYRNHMMKLDQLQTTNCGVHEMILTVQVMTSFLGAPSGDTETFNGSCIHLQVVWSCFRDFRLLGAISSIIED